MTAAVWLVIEGGAGYWCGVLGVLFAPPSMVGQRNWTPSSSQKRTGQISYEPDQGAG